MHFFYLFDVIKIMKDKLIYKKPYILEQGE
jgi:hypothetical protein